VKNNDLVTPPLEAGILDGVSRQMVIDLASDQGLSCTQRLFEPGELHSADECFITSTTREVMPVRKVDHQTFKAPGPVTAKVMAQYRECVRRTCK
jgi:branched-chain amino acid aminotransferase